MFYKKGFKCMNDRGTYLTLCMSAQPFGIWLKTKSIFLGNVYHLYEACNAQKDHRIAL